MKRFDEIHRLLTARLEGRATEEETAALADLLQSDREARRLYIRYMSDSLTLRMRPALPAAAVSRPWWSLGSPRLAWATSLGLLLILGAALWSGRETVSTYRGVAVLARAVDAEWQGEIPRAGGILTPGKLRLLRGLAQFEFFSGATVVVEGPAEIELVSNKEMSLGRGKARAKVPRPARGFIINGLGVGVIDLGTEFGISVDEAGSALQVFDGEIELRDRPEHLYTGQRLAVDPFGVKRPMPAAATFADQAHLARRAEDDREKRHERWRAETLKVRADPSLLVYYTFESQEPWDRVVRNRVATSTGGTEALGGGAIVGCRWTPGRWAGKEALEFKQPGDRVRLELLGRFDSMTFAAWVRFDGLDRTLNSLFLTDDWDQGEPHWQVNRHGQMLLGVSGPGNFFSPPVLTAHDLGHWSHLVTVYDGTTRSVTHYLNGRPVARKVIDNYVPLVVGAAEIGNWGMPLGAKEEQVRNLNGAIDELAIFGRALSSDEVAAAHENGRPQ